MDQSLPARMKKKRRSSDKQWCHQEVVTDSPELDEGVFARGGDQWEHDRGTKGDQKCFYQFDGYAIVAIDGIRQKESIASERTGKIEFVTASERLFVVFFFFFGGG